MLFGCNVVRSDHWVILSYMMPRLIISGCYDVISKKFKKLVISLLLVFKWFFRNKNIVILISIEFASKWWVMWQFLQYDLENDQFGQLIRNYTSTSGSMIRWSPKQYFSNQCNKCFNLRSHLVRLFPIFLYRIMTVRDGKIIFAISRGLSTDKHQKGLNVFLTSLWVIIAQKWRVSIIILEVGVPCGILTLWQFPDLQVELCEKRWELSRFSH